MTSFVSFKQATREKSGIHLSQLSYNTIITENQTLQTTVDGQKKTIQCLIDASQEMQHDIQGLQDKLGKFHLVIHVFLKKIESLIEETVFTDQTRAVEQENHKALASFQEVVLSLMSSLEFKLSGEFQKLQAEFSHALNSQLSRFIEQQSQVGYNCFDWMFIST